MILELVLVTYVGPIIRPLTNM